MSDEPTKHEHPESIAGESESFDPFASMTFTEDRCFLCRGSPVTKEHVFPKWLQNRYSLWGKELVLLNGTSLKYRQLLVPCCLRCNGLLGVVENRVRTAVDQGYDAVHQLDEGTIFQWMAKIFYGVLFRELSLEVDRTRPGTGTIFTAEQLQNFHMLHVFLRSAVRATTFEPRLPCSIFTLKLHIYGDERDFYWNDSLIPATLAIHMGDVGLIACLLDNGVIADVYEEVYDDMRSITLHPVQFAEFFSRVAYQFLLLNRNPTCIINVPDNDDDPVRVITMPIGGISTTPLFKEWGPEPFAELFSRSVWRIGGSINGLEFGQTLPQNMTWLYREDESPNEMPP